HSLLVRDCLRASYLLLHHPRTTASHPLSLLDALPISIRDARQALERGGDRSGLCRRQHAAPRGAARAGCLPALARRVPHTAADRSEEHTSELQSRENLVCRLLLEKKKYCGILSIFTTR